MKINTLVAGSLFIASIVLIATSGFMSLSAQIKPTRVRSVSGNNSPTDAIDPENRGTEDSKIILWNNCNETVSEIIRTIYVRTNTLQRAQRRAAR